ncbi:bifunctional folylpolyglutamate synthase/dihydrofolate synthase [Adhaeribacter aquaticus]|uniref:bifunctional folylpolyglutamate synthase/dihydrofolate synthase n=1 Tax=Adhaeribacter aquaticus TaxID=299567 RepID=UPI00047D91BA|nr:folylpolyglutamate synthase/dihydrofolate synthase family protein [Adhaeribacter aquaticus]
MTYQECIEYLYNQLPMFHRVGSSAFKKGLDNTVALLAALENPQHRFKSVHIAGTNGKGSSSNMLAAILQSAGYKTGLYTSPHLKSFTERIKINGIDIPEDYVVNFVARQQNLFEVIQPSFFEMTVALAFQYFADEQVDIAIIEVGLGGRLDSTNIITPLVSLITNISLDHQNLLGNDLTTIAGEKAGIIKPEIPVVISKRQPEVAEVFQKVAASKNAAITFADEVFKVVPKANYLHSQVIDVYNQEKLYLSDLEVALSGIYQQFNLPGVLQVTSHLNNFNYAVSEENIRDGLKNILKLTGFKGRWQILSNNPLTICDTGHNEDGIKQVLAQLNLLQAPQVHMVLGMVKDKDITTILQLLPDHYVYYFCQATIPRAMPASELEELAREFNLIGKSYPDVNQARIAAEEMAGPGDIIFIGGSTFVVAEIDGL